jgi:DNA modification methylase
MSEAVAAEREFRSKLEDLVPAEELLFPPTPSFGRYRPFLEHAVAHPAKANTRLLEFLIEKYTRPGDVVLDPMAGTGSTGVVAALHGRNAVQVEIEEKFYEWMERAREKVEKHQTLAPKGRIVNIRGDARRLSELLSKAGVVITSPPYSDSISRQGDPTGVRNVGISTITAREYSPNPENIGNLPLGDIDVVITSPPYEGSLEGTSRHTRGGIPSRDPTLAQTGTYATVLSGAVEGASTSPSKDNIGNLKSSDEEYEALTKGLIKGDRPTYLSEMLRVYGEMYKVLKPNGLAIIIVKPFIRNKRIVDLPWYTWLLMSKVGFKLEKLYKLRLKNLSFWRALYWRKYPEVPRISHEYIIVARKSDLTSH